MFVLCMCVCVSLWIKCCAYKGSTMCSGVYPLPSPQTPTVQGIIAAPPSLSVSWLHCGLLYYMYGKQWSLQNPKLIIQLPSWLYFMASCHYQDKIKYSQHFMQNLFPPWLLWLNSFLLFHTLGTRYILLS